MKKFTAYRIYCELTEKAYIGMTSQSVKQRLSYHKGRAKRGQEHPLYDDVRALGWRVFVVTELASCKTYEAAQELERLLIVAHDSLYPNGYNLETGGNRGKKASEFTKVRLAESHVGIGQSEAQLAKRAVSMRQAYDKDEGALRKLRSEQFSSMPRTEAHKAKIGAGNKGKVRSPELRAHLAQKTREYYARKKLEKEQA